MGNNRIDFSVLISVYSKDEPSYLYESLNSIINQTVVPSEIVIIKDGPLTSELDKIIDEYAIKYGFVRHKQLAKNEGLGIALQKGVLECNYNLIARMDADDISINNRFELQLKEFKNNPKLILLGSYMELFDTDENHCIGLKKVPINADRIITTSRRKNPFNHPTVMFRKDYIIKLGNYSNLKKGQDFELFIRVIKSGATLKNIPVPLVKFRLNKNYYKRRKSLYSIKNTIDIVYKSMKTGHSTIFDFLLVLMFQFSLFFTPILIVRSIDEYRRKK